MEDPRLAAVLADHPCPLLFATVSGAHLYGFPSPDSDYDLRGVHVLPLAEAVRLEPGRETITLMEVRDGLEIDLVTHDARKFFRMLLRRNGYVLEQLFSPLVLSASPWLPELREVAGRCLTRHHAHHYLGFAQTQWKLFQKEQRVKPLLYTFRVLLTGLHLMRSHEVEANLVTLNEGFALPYLPELIERKLSGPEKGLVPEADLAFFEREVRRLVAELEAARDASSLPEAPSAFAELDDLLVRVRLAEMV